MLPRILKNFNLFVNGKGLAGVADEVELPEISIKTDDFRAGGMDSEVEIDMGTEKMSAKWKLADPDADILSLVGLTSGNTARVIAKGAYVRDSDGARVRLWPKWSAA
jgi:P2 family phage contractile tail tube protein